MGKKARNKNIRTIPMTMNSRELRRHPEKVMQVQTGRKNAANIFMRAFLSNGRKRV